MPGFAPSALAVTPHHAFHAGLCALGTSWLHAAPAARRRSTVTPQARLPPALTRSPGRRAAPAPTQQAKGAADTRKSQAPDAQALASCRSPPPPGRHTAMPHLVVAAVVDGAGVGAPGGHHGVGHARGAAAAARVLCVCACARNRAASNVPTLLVLRQPLDPWGQLVCGCLLGGSAEHAVALSLSLSCACPLSVAHRRGRRARTP